MFAGRSAASSLEEALWVVVVAGGSNAYPRIISETGKRARSRYAGTRRRGDLTRRARQTMARGCGR